MEGDSVAVDVVRAQAEPVAPGEAAVMDALERKFCLSRPRRRHAALCLHIAVLAQGSFKLSKRALAEALGCAVRTTRMVLANLERYKIIERLDPDKRSDWSAYRWLGPLPPALPGAVPPRPATGVGQPLRVRPSVGVACLWRGRLVSPRELEALLLVQRVKLLPARRSDRWHTGSWEDVCCNQEGWATTSTIQGLVRRGELILVDEAAALPEYATELTGVTRNGAMPAAQRIAEALKLASPPKPDAWTATAWRPKDSVPWARVYVNDAQTNKGLMKIWIRWDGCIERRQAQCDDPRVPQIEAALRLAVQPGLQGVA